MKQYSIFSREMWLKIRTPDCLKAKPLSTLLAGGVFMIAGLSLPVASATTLTEAAALLNIQFLGEVKSPTHGAEKPLQGYDNKNYIRISDDVSRQQQSIGIDDNVIPFLSNLVERISHRKDAHDKATPEKVLREKIVVKSEPVVIRRIAKVAKLPVVKQWAGLHRTMPTPNYSKAKTLVKKVVVAKPPAVLQILPRITDEKKAQVQYSIKQ